MFFGKTGITVHFEGDDSDNRGNYRKLLRFQKKSNIFQTSKNVDCFFGRLGLVIA
ncbi:unnamed protein product [Acanthoscelides obtectus]|uniref:Uncharacterized protein n=1 Tax=Acanthoscelides obtectus TaxID=200917 RepID=A0A9P0PBY2_ACAOB|nr:unnamed protein product [Acanthoscelides obtectus]CAK1628617.1 hypothetical protein AOBTE_LOCUS5309 [Acanthoscelides obtectus]